MMKRLMPFIVPALLVGQLAVNKLHAQETKKVEPGTPVTITVQPAAATNPPVTITLGTRNAKVVPVRNGCTHTGGGNIDVATPSSDTVVVTMSGVAVAYCGPHGASASQEFCLTQDFEIAFDNPKVKAAKLTIEGRLIGLLRSHCKGGSAGVGNAHASVACGPQGIAGVHMHDYAVSGGENLSVNDHDGPFTAHITPGKYTLHQTFQVSACAPKCLLPCKAPSSEFAPDPALDPLWISHKEPFRGASKKDFGFQVTIKVAEVTVEEPKEGNGNGNGKAANNSPKAANSADKKEEKKEAEKKEAEKKSLFQ